MAKRIGLARTQALIENLKREIQLNGTEFKGGKTNIISVTATRTLLATESGSTIYWTLGSAHNITLPDAEVGLKYTFVIAVGAAAGHYIACQSADRFFGKAVVLSETDDQVGLQNQAIAASARKALHIQSDISTTGGNAGDVVTIEAIDGTYWRVTADLHTTNANPSSIAVFKNAVP